MKSGLVRTYSTQKSEGGWSYSPATDGQSWGLSVNPSGRPFRGAAQATIRVPTSEKSCRREGITSHVYGPLHQLQYRASTVQQKSHARVWGGGMDVP